MELISEREAARRFAPAGLSLSACQHLLATGIAGPPQRTASTTLYDAAAVDAVAARPGITEEDFDAAFPLGVVVARLPRGRTISASTTWPETDEVLAGPWRVGDGDGFAMTGSVAFGEGLPLVICVSGFVLAGAWITGVLDAEDSGLVRFDLDAPGPWLAGIHGRRMRGHRGRPVELVGWRLRPTGPRLTRS